MSEKWTLENSYPALPPVPILHSILNSGFAAIAVVDSEGKFIYLNQQDADLYREHPDNLIGKTPEKWVGKKIFSEFRAEDQMVLDGGVTVHLAPYTRLDFHGDEHWFDTIKIPFRIEGREDPILLVIHRDITQIKKAELERDQLQRQLHQQEKSLMASRLAAQMAHQLNSLMMVGMNSAENLFEVAKADKEALTNQQQLVKSIKKAAFQIKQFQLYGDRFDAVRTDFELMSFVQKMIPSLLEVFASNLSAEIKMGEGHFYISTDKSLLEHLISNIFSEMSVSPGYPSKGRLTISVERSVKEPTEVCLTISDHQSVPHVGWNPEDDLSSLTLPSIDSPGLGFYVISRIIDLTGVRLTRFFLPKLGNQWIIHVPRSQSPAAILENPISKGLGLPLQGVHVLVVDDEPLILKMFQLALTKCGALVSQATTAANAWQFLETSIGKKFPDIVVSDLIMPGKENGIDLRNKCSSRFPHLPFVWMSGEKFEVFGSLEQLPPLTSFVAKPAPVARLVEEIKKLLERI